MFRYDSKITKFFYGPGINQEIRTAFGSPPYFSSKPTLDSKMLASWFLSELPMSEEGKLRSITETHDPHDWQVSMTIRAKLLEQMNY